MALQKKLPADSTSNNQSYNSTDVHYVYWYCREGASALGKNTRRVVPLWSLALVAQNKEKKMVLVAQWSACPAPIFVVREIKTSIPWLSASLKLF